MPMAQPKNAESAWLNLGMTDATTEIEFAREFAVTVFVHYLVNPRVNNARIEDAELIDPFPNPAYWD